MYCKLILVMFALTLFLTSPPVIPRGDSSEQQIEKRKCPTVEVKGPSKSKAFKNISYRAKVKNFSGATPPILKWSLVGGVLIHGQGSDMITVEPRARQIKATLQIENLPVGCDSDSDMVITKLTDIPGIHLPPLVTSFKASPVSIIRPCPAGTKSDTCTSSVSEVQLSVDVLYPREFELDLLFTWDVTVGRLKGDGRTVTWDLSGVAKGTYTVSVEVNDGNQLTAAGSTTVTVADCNDCKPAPATDVTKPSSRLLPSRGTSHARLRSTDTPH